MPKPDLYQGGTYMDGERLVRYYVKSGEKRPPKKGEFYLSGAIPTSYQALNDLSQTFHILRPATEEEITCECCGQFRRNAVIG